MKTTIQALIFTLSLLFVFTACKGGKNGNTTHDKAIEKLTAYAQSNGTAEAPTLQDYLDAGVTGIDTDAKLAELNQIIAGLTQEEVDTTEEVQALANELGVSVTIPTTPSPSPSPSPSPTPDTTPPVITITGGSTVSVVQFSTYTDAGATAVDAVDGTVSVTTAGSVDTNITGSYTITYTATDAAGNTATATRTVTVTIAPDTTPPVITIKGGSTASVMQFSTYTDAGATAVDAVDGTVSVATTGSADTNTTGVYTITYTATDAAGNTATATRTVTVTTFSIIHNGTTYGAVVSPYTGKVWLDRNLGAARVCESFNDIACYGDYYQWGRNFDGHQDSISNTTNTLATDVNSAGDSFIKNEISWTLEDSDGSIRSANWSKTDGSSVCPVGFRVPTIEELEAENISRGVTNSATAFTNFLKLPLAGYRIDYLGNLLYQGSLGIVWSSSASGSYSHCVGFGSDNVNECSYGRANGFTVRCLRD